MIPPRLLVYRRTESSANLETLPETWRRKKSCGDLFQNGYRVRQGRPGLEEKERRTGLSHSVWSCLCLLCNWGKALPCTVHNREETLWLLQTISPWCLGPAVKILEEFLCFLCTEVRAGVLVNPSRYVKIKKTSRQVVPLLGAVIPQWAAARLQTAAGAK